MIKISGRCVKEMTNNFSLMILIRIMEIIQMCTNILTLLTKLKSEILEKVH